MTQHLPRSNYCQKNHCFFLPRALGEVLITLALAKCIFFAFSKGKLVSLPLQHQKKAAKKPLDSSSVVSSSALVKKLFLKTMSQSLITI